MRLYASPPINDQEAYQVELANGQLDRARETFYRDQPGKTRTAIARAFEHAVGIRYSLDQVVDRVMFSPCSGNASRVNRGCGEFTEFYFSDFGTFEIGWKRC